jgi:asparagine synthase (glutamine-hydrolysing)
MCGIASVVVADPAGYDLDSVAERMQARLLHRGPDDRGRFVAPRRHCALAHTRLSILDLSNAGHQPMSTPDGRHTIVFNGEIYNYRELRRELEQDGVDFRSHTDTEVVLNLFALNGVKCLKRLRGMFGLSVWDDEAQQLTVARDRYGIKPVYFHASRAAFVCASEVRALLASGLVSKRISQSGLAAYLRFGSVQDSHTLIDSVETLLPGHYLVIEPAQNALRVTQAPYVHRFDTELETPANLNRAEAVSQLRRILEDSMRSHLASDVPLGVFLSGGVDSSAIVALLKRVSDQTPKTFTVAFADSDYSEAEHARTVAKTFATDHCEISLSEQKLQSLLPAALAAMDQPTMDGINTYVIAEAVKQAGVTVALSGLGGDELFAGYPSFRRALRLRKLAGVPRGLRTPIARLGSATASSARRQKFWRMLASDTSARAAYRISRELFSAADIRALLPESRACLEPAPADNDGDIVNAVAACEFQGYMTNTLLRDTDQMSMAHGLEVRVPFIDAEIVEFVMALPGGWKLERQRPKPLLLDALGGLLPESIWRRPKMGFTLPFERWMRSGLRPEIESTLAAGRLGRLGIDVKYSQRIWQNFAEHPQRETWSRPWAIYVLDRWCALNGIEV